MVKICRKCFRIHGSTFDHRKMCVDCRCKLFACDEFIAPVIRDLNLKGYYTDYCCSGHLHNLVNVEDHPVGDYLCDKLGGCISCWQCYIMFARGVVIDSAPMNFEIECDSGVHSDQYAIQLLHPMLESLDYVQALCFCTAVWGALMKWVEHLPSLKGSIAESKNTTACASTV
mgnify:CR=1 FL=1